MSKRKIGEVLSDKSSLNCMCLTFYNEEELKDFINWDKLQYFVYQKEKCPDTGREHWQAYAELKGDKGVKFKKIKSIIPSTHIERRLASQEKAIAYCKKEESRIEGPWEIGYPKEQGRRFDLEDCCDLLDKGTPMLEVARNYKTQFIRHHKGLERYSELVEEDESMKKLKTEFDEVVLRPWQEVCLEKIKNQDNRTVLWVYDEEGKKGKTWFARYLVAVHKAFYCRGGKVADVAYSYKKEPIVAFDFTRSKEEVVNYELIESFKDGMIFSSKYNSSMKIFSPAKVVIFANFHQEHEKLSLDRWDDMDLSNFE